MTRKNLVDLVSEPDLRLFGPASGFDGQKFVMMVPFRKSTTKKFSIETIETAVKVFLVDHLPPGVSIDSEKPIEKTWSEEYLTDPSRERQVLVRMSVFVKEEPVE
jgi:hypothetical protein